MLRTCGLTVLSETHSSLAISGRDRLVGRYRSTRSSAGLSLREHPLDHRRCVEVRRRCWQFGAAVCTGGMTDRVEQGKPELLGVVLVASHLHEGEPVRLARTAGPGAQQAGLAATGRNRDDRQLTAASRSSH